jgi:hypothetical protein
VSVEVKNEKFFKLCTRVWCTANHWLVRPVEIFAEKTSGLPGRNLLPRELFPFSSDGKSLDAFDPKVRQAVI